MGKVAIITGVTGQDGALLSEFLLGKEYQVVGIDRRTSSKTDWRIKDLGLYEHDQFTLASGDLIDPGSISRIVQEYQPDEFYNLAAMSFVKESWTTPAATMQINAVGCINCLEALRQYAYNCRFYQASTSEMLGGECRTETFDEHSLFHPRSPYGVSKLAAHWSTINYRESYDMFTCCGILFNHESEYRGLEFVTRKITDGIARVYMGQQSHIELGNMEPKRDWGYAEDYVRGMWLMLQNGNPDDFVLATGKAYSIYDFVRKTLDAVHMSNVKVEDVVKHNLDFDRPADVGHLLGNADRAKRVLGWEPEVSFTDMVKIMVEKDIERVRNET